MLHGGGKGLTRKVPRTVSGLPRVYVLRALMVLKELSNASHASIAPAIASGA